MIKVTVLLENNSISKKYKPKHGLSLLIEYNNFDLMLDAGPDNTIIENAKRNNIDLTKINHLFLSHNHIDHTGGLNAYIKINKNGNIYLMDKISNKYYIKFLFFYIPVGLRLKNINKFYFYSERESININDKVFFIKNNCNKYKKPLSNKNLYKKEGKKLVNDNFEHEGILVLEENNELVIFNSCSHNGVLNIIETVRRKLPGKKIKSFIGGMHLYDPLTKKYESNEYLDYLADGLKNMNITVYTGHCTGKYALDYLKNILGEKIREINAGMEIIL